MLRMEDYHEFVASLDYEVKLWSQKIYLKIRKINK